MILQIIQVLNMAKMHQIVCTFSQIIVSHSGPPLVLWSQLIVLSPFLVGLDHYLNAYIQKTELKKFPWDHIHGLHSSSLGLRFLLGPRFSSAGILVLGSMTSVF